MSSLAEKMAARIAAKGPRPEPKPHTTLSAKLLESRPAPHPNSRVAKALASGGVSRTRELERILALPRRRIDDALRDATPQYLIPDVRCPGCDLCRAGTPKLWPLQSAALFEAAAHGGLFAPLAVGAGKTLLSLLVGASMGAKKIVLLVPPEVRNQLIERDIPRYGRHYRLPLDRLAIVSYSELSTAKTADVLDKIKPDLIVSDECHRLKRMESARTKRFRRFMKDHPECRFVGMSGTVTTRSIKDFAHLIELALRKNSPLPGNYREVSEWSEALDPQPEGMFVRAPGALLLFCDDVESPRAGFRRRLIETPGVVATSEGAIGTSLYIRASNPEIPRSIRDALAHLEATWAIGDEELEDAVAKARVDRQISQGFYYRWAWPDGVKDREWLDARAAWHKTVRDVLKHRSRKGLDSPLLVARACQRGELEAPIVASWNAWAAVKERPEPPVEPVWIDEFLIEAAHRWLQERLEAGEKGIIWFEHRAVETALRARRFRVFGAGEDAELGAARAENNAVIACSITAHGTGKNLQGWSHNLILCPPPNGTRFEQALGRTHRPGQMADEVIVDVCQHTDALREAFGRAMADAAYVQETQGQRQKLLYATKIGFR